jgi:hypothetical protein
MIDKRKALWPAVFASFLSTFPAYASGQRVPRIKALYFVTEPLIASAVSSEPDGHGGVVGRQVGGMVTSQFPQGVVRLKLLSYTSFNPDDIPAFIKRNFKFQCGDVLSRELPADWSGSDVFSYQNGRFTKKPVEHPKAPPFETDLVFISQGEVAMIVQARCTLPAAEGANPGEPPASLLEEAFILRPDEPTLIGFPYHQRNVGVFVFWLALRLEY